MRKSFPKMNKRRRKTIAGIMAIVLLACVYPSFPVYADKVSELEQKLKDAETMKDDNLSQALSVIKKYSGADELTQAMVQEMIAKVVVTDPEHVEIVWKFKDEVRNKIKI